MVIYDLFYLIFLVLWVANDKGRLNTYLCLLIIFSIGFNTPLGTTQQLERHKEPF